MQQMKTAVKKSRSDFAIDIVLYAVIAVILVITVYPLYFVIIASVSDPLLVSSGKVLLAPQGINFDGYIRIFQDSRVWVGYRNTIFYTLLGTLFSIACTMPAAYALSRRELPFRTGLMFFFSFTMFFGGGLIPTYFLVDGLGLRNTPWVMIIPFAVNVYNLIVARSFFQSTLPEELLEAAQIDGCSYTRFFFSMALPLAKSIIAVIALYYAVAYWNEYMRALIYIQNEDLMPLQIALKDILVSNQAFASDGGMSMDAAAKQRLADMMKYALIVVSTLPLMILYPLLQKYFEKGVMIGSIKG